MKIHTPKYCQGCGESLEEQPPTQSDLYQKVDLPRIRPIITEHQYQSKTCSCEHTTTYTSPKWIRYRETIKALSTYLSVRQYMPYERMKEFFNQVCCRASIRTDSLVNFVEGLSRKSEAIYETIREVVQGSSIAVGRDETSLNVKGKNQWAWTWQTQQATLIGVSESRGAQAISDYFPEGFKRAVLVHDRWATQLNTPSKAHQLCLAHLLRDLQYAVDLEGSKWADEVSDLLRETIEQSSQSNRADGLDPKSLEVIYRRWGEFFNEELPEDQAESLKLQRGLLKHKDKIFVFREQPGVPPTNNSSERAIRNIKVKQKVSGLFRSMPGAQTFIKLRSVIDTCIKQPRDVLPVLQLLAH